MCERETISLMVKSCSSYWISATGRSCTLIVPWILNQDGLQLLLAPYSVRSWKNSDHDTNYKMKTTNSEFLQFHILKKEATLSILLSPLPHHHHHRLQASLTITQNHGCLEATINIRYSSMNRWMAFWGCGTNPVWIASVVPDRCIIL